MVEHSLTQPARHERRRDNDPGARLLRRIGGPSASTTQLFSYGTLQELGVQVATFGRALTGVSDTLPGHHTDWVVITDHDVRAVSGRDRHPIVRPTADGAGTVAGTVLTLTTDELAAGDRYEVADYRRHRVTLGSGTLAWVYLAADADR